MQKTILPMIVILLLSTPAFASSMDRSQQEKDFEVKKRMFGIKYPWEMVDPYPNVRSKTNKITPSKSAPVLKESPILKNVFPFDMPISPDSPPIPFA